MDTLPPEPETFTVRRLLRRLKYVVENAFPPVRVRGEVANLTLHSSGHLYFTLRDEAAQIRCAMFRRDRETLRFAPSDGMELEAHGRVEVYERGGSVQLVVRRLLPVGKGERELALAALREKLAAEGLFDATRKPPLPAFALRVGVVTSESGAAVHDVLEVLAKRSPATRVVLHPVRVQGEGAAAEIAAAVDRMNAYGELDVLIVGRGGGSAEDLWAFNEEPVVRSIARSRIPVISAVGHETDFTLSDYAATLRAPTPSAAAERVSPDRRELRLRLTDRASRLAPLLHRRLSRARERHRALAGRYGWTRLPAIVKEWSRHRDELEERLGRSAAGTLARERARLTAAGDRLRALDPLAILARGYAVVRERADGPPLREAGAVAGGSRIHVTLHRGRLAARVEEVSP